MNNIFNINRFWNLIQMDAKRFITNYGLSLLIICLSPTIIWLFSLITGLSIHFFGRILFYYFVLFIAMMMTPVKVYGDVNLKREGVAYAMLPVSALEKCLSMFIFCAIATPIIAYSGIYAIDTLLTVIPWGGFDGFIKYFGFDYLVNLYKQTGIEQIENINQAVGPLTLRLYYYIGIVSWVAMFMLGNLVFQKRKNAKTILCYLGIQYVLSMIMNVVIINNADSFTARFSDITADTALHYIHNFIIILLIISTIIALALIYFSYRKIRTQKY